MKIIKYHDVIDATGYSDYLLEIKDALPKGAYQFASDKNHYDFGAYCTHDLKFYSFEIKDNTEINAILQLKKNKFKHDKDLIISYMNCRDISIRLDDDIKESCLDDIVIDEITMDNLSGYVIHEIRFISGTLSIKCKDLEAVWGDIS